MNRYMSSAELKRNAKSQLFGNMGTVIGAFLLHMLCTLPIGFLISALNLDTIPKFVIYFVLSLGAGLLDTVFDMGESLVALKVACNQSAASTDIFYGFKNAPMKILIVRVIPVFISELLAMPVLMTTIMMNNAMPPMDEYMQMVQTTDVAAMSKFLQTMLPISLLNIGVVALQLGVSLIVSTLFGQTLFLMLDYPDKSATQIIKLGIKIMKGNWGRYIYLRLSFIPWLLLRLVTCYLSDLYVYPYRNVTMADFYLDVIRNYKVNNTGLE